MPQQASCSLLRHFLGIHLASRMKTNRLYLTFTALTALSLGTLGWHLAGREKGAAPQVRSMPPSLNATRLVSKFGTQPHFTAIAKTQETPETHNARIMADYEKKMAADAVVSAAYESGGFGAEHMAQMEQWKGEYMQFFKLLGLNDALRAKVFPILQRAEALGMENFMKISESRRKGVYQEPSNEAQSRIIADVKGMVGAENYDKIKYWENTWTQRERAQVFEAELQRQSITLAADQTTAVVDALYKARHGQAWFDISLPFIPLSEKLAYIEEVKQTLTPVLSSSALELLGQQLRKIVDRSQKNPGS